MRHGYPLFPPGCAHMWWASTVLFLLCLSGAAAAVDAERLEIARRAFATLDVDGNGEVTSGEFAAKKIIAFSAPDRNGDNSLGRDEVRFSPEEFNAVDRDGDGKISGLEFLESPYGRFETYDRDENGTIVLEEFVETLLGG